MTVQLAPIAVQRFFDNLGLPAIGGQVYTYLAGTSTPQATYTDSTGGTPNTNPIILNARGEAAIWLTVGVSYKFIVKDALGNILQTTDGISADGGLLSRLASSIGATLIGWIQAGTGAVARTVASKLGDVPSVVDYGAVGNGATDDSGARNADMAANGVAFYPWGKTSYNVVSWNGIGTQGAVIRFANTFEADEGFGGQGAINVFRNTTTSKDGVYSEHYGTGTGYAVHGISYATTGSGVGGACFGLGAGIVGNKRGTGAGANGNGVYGSAGIDNGDNQTGVYGQYTGTGVGGTGGAFVHSGTATSGNALFAWRSGTGGGQAAQVLRDGAGDGLGATITRTGTGKGDGLDVECSTTDSTGSVAIVGTRKASNGGTIWSIGQLGFYDGTQSVGVYGYAPAGGTIQWAGRFDGKIYVTGAATLGSGAVPFADGSGNLGSPSFRFNTVFALNSAINTSDRNAKTDIKSIDEAVLRVGRRLKGLICQFLFIDAVKEKGTGARIHFGIIAQDVHQAFADEGLDAAAYGMFCSDTWTNDAGEEVTRLGVRYDELFALILAAL